MTARRASIASCRFGARRGDAGAERAHLRARGDRAAPEGRHAAAEAAVAPEDGRHRVGERWLVAFRPLLISSGDALLLRVFDAAVEGDERRCAGEGVAAEVACLRRLPVCATIALHAPVSHPRVHVYPCLPIASSVCSESRPTVLLLCPRKRLSSFRLAAPPPRRARHCCRSRRHAVLPMRLARHAHATAPSPANHRPPTASDSRYPAATPARSAGECCIATQSFGSGTVYLQPSIDWL